MSHCEVWPMKNTLQKANPALKHFLQSFFIKATDAVTHAEESLKDKDHVASPCAALHYFNWTQIYFV